MSHRGITGVAHLFGPGGINRETFDPQPTIGQEKRSAQTALHQHQRYYDTTKYSDRMAEHRPGIITQANAYPDGRLPESPQPQPPKNKSSLKTNDHTGIHKPKHEKKRPPALNIGLLEFGAPNLRAAGHASQNGEAAMLAAFANANANDSTNFENYNTRAPENLDDNDDYDEANAYRWRDGGRTKKRRNTRRRTRKYKSKRKQQTRKKTFRKRK